MNSNGSRSKSIDAYIDAKPAYSQPICRKLRALIRKAGPDLTESIKWSAPSYTGRSNVCGFAAFKEHVSLYFHQGARISDPDHVLSHGDGNVSGKSVKFTSVDEIDEKKLARLLKEAVTIDRDQSEKPKPRATRAPLPIPPELAAELKKAPKANAFFEMLPPSCRREYIEWITSAKRLETLARRLESTIEMLSKEKRLNEKYRK
jgi:uncharacterized protein YdeI (YjbR/CyaY-like superfamily)